MRNTSFLLIITIFLSAFPFNRSIAQRECSKLPQDYIGIWLGGSSNKSGARNELSNLLWKIHEVDNTKKQIILTEMGEYYDVAKEISAPFKQTYTGWTNQNGMTILMKSSSGNLMTINLKLISGTENKILQSVNENDKYIFYLGKISQDTTTYIKPKNPLSVKIVRSGILE